MLSHLRFHRRGPSNPSSPNPDQAAAPSPWEHSPSNTQPPFLQQDVPSNDARSPSVAVSSPVLPPTLPPITRVTSSEAESQLDYIPAPDPKASLSRQSVKSPFNDESGFMGGVALQKYRREQQQQLLQEQQHHQQHHQQHQQQQQQQQSPQPQTTKKPDTLNVYTHTLAPTSPSAGPAPRTTAQESRPALPTSQTQPQHQAISGRRPPAARLATEPSPVAAPNNDIEVSKGRRALPFLKNPMSTLLMRRSKTNHNAPEVTPLPLNESFRQPSYDPRIRGTRVHDFSAPRSTRRPVPSPLPDQIDGDDQAGLFRTSSRDGSRDLSTQGRHKSNASDSGQSGSFGTASQLLPDAGSIASNKTRSSSNLDKKPLPEPPSVPEENIPPSVRSTSSAARVAPNEAVTALRASAPSTRTNRSRNASIGTLSGKDVLSSVPRHMKSTSSRFSFDMVGAAKQEKLLEERHRQRELEKKTNEPESDTIRDSRFDDFDEDGFDYDAMMEDDAESQLDYIPAPDPKVSLSRQSVKSPFNDESGFMGGVALQKYRREQQQQLLQEQQHQHQQHQQQSLQPQTTRKPDTLNVYTHTLAPTSPSAVPAPRATAQESRPGLPALQTQPQNQAISGRRPPAARLATEPSPVAAPNNDIEVSKGRRALPFLKNPMSTLLMRRSKTNHNAPEVTPLPLNENFRQPSYDPRIRGTRVHDFSAPRSTRRPVPSPLPDQIDGDDQAGLFKTSSRDGSRDLSTQGRHKSNASDSGQSGSFGTASQLLPDAGSIASNKTRSSSNLDKKPLPEPPSVPEENIPPSVRSTSPASRVAPNEAVATLRASAPSTRTNRSRNASIGALSGRDVLSSVPRHMKSTSSRFSFDMVGAAKQEKLLEERHRQRELEKKTNEPESDTIRDSRFDDFDEDGFDYDAMMEDDGLEEPIPMADDDYGFDDGFEETIPMAHDDYDDGFEERIPIKSDEYDVDEEPVPMTDDDYDEDEEPFPYENLLSSKLPAETLPAAEADTAKDPDDDQENFAGFVFQRSNPTSELATPRSAGLLITPRDADGKVIGFAMSSTPRLPATVSPELPAESSLPSDCDHDVAGLGIRGLNLADHTDSLAVEQTSVSERTATADDPTPAGPPARKDDLYFDGGLLDEMEFAGEGDGSTFDESIFDMIDTDKYGRPIPGAFAAAQASRQASQAAVEAAAAEEQSKRVSDSTSRLSALSEADPSTAHTSLSVGVRHLSGTSHEGEGLSSDRASALTIPCPEQDKMAVYQAALAAAANEAAANGKFRRDSSPPPSEIMSAGPELPQDFTDDSHLDTVSFDDYEDDYTQDMDGYDFDDDAIIAEANADALANDGDGWYGSEFGFYSAPGPQRHSRDNSDEKTFEYSNGGFFGPSGVNRSKSGRVVSREPNLTPITERSEYSNRNSIMSLAVPPLGSGPSSLASPGLAQLAMMADGDDNMNLSALLRLRSRAWGGSQISLNSSREGSPMSERGDGASSPWGSIPPNSFLSHYGHGRKNSSFSMRSRDVDSSEAGSACGSPTLTMSIPMMSSPPPPLPSMIPTSPLSFSASNNNAPSYLSFHEPVLPSIEQDGESSTFTNTASREFQSPDLSHPNLSSPPSNASSSRRPGLGHKHKSSADSISYIKEEDRGESRWILERRYTAETGQVEVEREVLEKGRI
ncbi:hypothetical protein BN1708_013027 [Verticillium longisporum]|uniref:AGC-kinase C-terminal domain-containing protein n=1 Tax=Verticillium longisporum TaxID=100787 RepID=A0A0G4LGL2_VERLO|nr:hypothetical protein BN1708_013027 [Verticillium longisporum]